MSCRVLSSSVQVLCWILPSGDVVVSWREILSHRKLEATPIVHREVILRKKDRKLQT
jgi:hypothetical protein